MKFLTFSLPFWVIFALLDPDPDSEYGSGSGSTDPIESESKWDRDPDPQPCCEGTADAILVLLQFLQKKLNPLIYLLVDGKLSGTNEPLDSTYSR